MNKGAKLVLIVIGILGISGAAVATIIIAMKAIRKQCEDDQIYSKKYSKCIDRNCSQVDNKYIDPDTGICKCVSGYRIMNGRCQEDCPNRCTGPAHECYDPTTDTCTANGEKCISTSYNPQTGKCCSDEQEYNTVMKKCSECTGVICGNKCQHDCQCLDDGVCCPQLHVHKNAENKSVCCEVFSSATKECCEKSKDKGDGTGEVRVGEDGRCQNGCGPTDWCDVDTQTCFVATTYPENKLDGETVYGCRNNTCRFTEPVYDPAPQGTHADIHVCASKDYQQDHSVPVATCNVPDITNYTKTITAEGLGEEGKICSPEDCLNITKEEGVEKVVWNESKETEGDGRCVATVSCLHGTGTKDDCTGMCPLGEENGLRCCHDADGKYKGLICMDYGDNINPVCADNKCIRGWQLQPTGVDEMHSCVEVLLTNTKPETQPSGEKVTLNTLFKEYGPCEDAAREYSASQDRCDDYSDTFAKTVTWHSDMEKKYGGDPGGNVFGGAPPWFRNDGHGKCKRSTFLQAIAAKKKEDPSWSNPDWREYTHYCSSNNMNGDVWDSATTDHYNCNEPSVKYPKGTYQCGRSFDKDGNCEFAWKKCDTDGGCVTPADANCDSGSCWNSSYKFNGSGIPRFCDDPGDSISPQPKSGEDTGQGYCQPDKPTKNCWEIGGGCNCDNSCPG